MTLYDEITAAVDASENQGWGKGSRDDVARIADEILSRHGIIAEWFIETSQDREGNTFYEVSICAGGEEIVSDWDYDREGALDFVRMFTNVTPVDGEVA